MGFADTFIQANSLEARKELWFLDKCPLNHPLYYCLVLFRDRDVAGFEQGWWLHSARTALQGNTTTASSSLSTGIQNKHPFITALML